MTLPPDPPEPFITDDQALSWFMKRRGGGALYETHISLIQSVFGYDVPIRLRAAVDPSSGQPTVLIIDIDKSPDDEDSWHRLIQVQQGLLERQQGLARNYKLVSPFRNVVVSLGGEQSNWDDVVAEVESEE
jgi:hypothetical protein